MQNRTFAWKDVALVFLLLCVVILGGLLLRTRIAPPADLAHSGPPISEEPEWRQYVDGGHRLGPADAAVTIVEFSDFQCSFCRTQVDELRAIQERYPEDVAIIYRHYPLESLHPFAKKAAIASECAASQGRFREFHDLLFEQQDSIGLKDWSAFASEAGVGDAQDFDRCVEEEQLVGRVDDDIEAARRMGVDGTPTLLVNHLRVGGMIRRRELNDLVERVR